MQEGEVIYTGLYARELFNIALAAGFFTSAAIILFWRLFPEMRIGGWYKNPGNQFGVGLVILLGGEAIYRVWAGVLLWASRTGGLSSTSVERAFWIATVGFIVTSLGILCSTRVVLQPPRTWPWVTVLVAMLAAVAIAVRFG